MICKHEKLLKAKNVRALVRNEHLASDAEFGKDGIMRTDYVLPNTLRYKTLVYCANSACERVFFQER